MRGTVLIVDDETGIRQVLRAGLEAEGHAVLEAGLAQEGEEQIRSGSPDCILLDLVLPDRTGTDLLESILTLDPDLPVVMMTGHATVETAVQAMRQGAFDYLVKPLRLEAVGVVVTKALESRRLRQECLRLRRQIEERFSARTLVGTSEAMRRVLQLVQRSAASPSPVLICGEAGVGKARVARAIHEAGRSGSPFVTVDCTTLEADPLERAVFGDPDPALERGAIHRAGSGTVFLREVGSIPAAVQARLAEYLDGRNARNGNGPGRRPCRLLASSRTDPGLLRREGRLREDLFYRLHVVRIDIPPLRERREDIPVYLSHFLRQSAESLGTAPKTMSAETRIQVMDYPWPGNLRQLENAVERAFALAYGRDLILPDDLPAEVRASSSSLIPWLAGKTHGDSLPEILTAFEHQMLMQALERSNWVKTRAAALLKIKRTTLIEKMKRLGIPLKDGRWPGWA
ncbi:MAG: sigma-54-dependent Fis family transcriptional regulator [Acidobacteria bacterium]|nr:sigma-54-dependent Fis family transcriptional regulator [Acidobacteriota bacterium]